MKLKHSLTFFLLLFLFSHHTCCGIQTKGGKLEDVLVMGSGGSEHEVVTEFSSGYYPRGPKSIDVDKEGNIYVLDWLGERVQKYDKEGRWVSSFPVSMAAPSGEALPQIYDIAVDNWGNVYVTGRPAGIPNNSIHKYSPEGKLLIQVPNVAGMERGNFGHVVYWFVLTDKSGRVYNFGKEHLGGVVVYSPQGELKKVVNRCEYDYFDVGIVQKELGDDVYFRVSKYLLRTSLEEFLQSGKIDTIAVLPDWTRLLKFADDKLREPGWVEYPLTLIGFDRDTCFYFHQLEDWCKDRGRGMCEIHWIYKFRLEKGALIEAGEAVIYFERGKAECSDKELFDFYKQFIVSGDGTIYFLHGTVDTVKVSKVILDELEFER